MRAGVATCLEARRAQRLLCDPRASSTSRRGTPVLPCSAGGGVGCHSWSARAAQERRHSARRLARRAARRYVTPSLLADAADHARGIARRLLPRNEREGPHTSLGVGATIEEIVEHACGRAAGPVAVSSADPALRGGTMRRRWPSVTDICRPSVGPEQRVVHAGASAMSSPQDQRRRRHTTATAPPCALRLRDLGHRRAATSRSRPARPRAPAVALTRISLPAISAA